MAAYLIVSVLAGVVSLVTGLVGYGTGVWMALLLYVLASWAAFAFMLLAALAVSYLRKPTSPARPQMLTQA